jgi:hypothetical protein
MNVDGPEGPDKRCADDAFKMTACVDRSEYGERISLGVF